MIMHDQADLVNVMPLRLNSMSEAVTHIGCPFDGFVMRMEPVGVY